MFVEKSYTKCAEEAIPRSLSKIKIGHISRSIGSSLKQFNSLHANLRSIKI